jgi:hypothetical protein
MGNFFCFKKSIYVSGLISCVCVFPLHVSQGAAMLDHIAGTSYRGLGY